MNPLRLAIFSLVALLLPAGIAFAGGGVLYVSPDFGSYSIGQTFTVQVLADSGEQAINAAEADLTFNPEALEVESISTDGSILGSWPTPPAYSNTDGTIEFSGVTAEHFTGTAGLLVTITFKALSNMQSDARLAAGAILAADDRESNIITSMRSGVYNIAPQEDPDGPAAAADASSTDSSDGSGDRMADDIGADDASSTDGAQAAADTDVPDQSDSNGPAAPVLSNYQDQIQVGERIIVEGTAPASSTVSVYLQEGSDPAERTDLTSGSDGSFTFVSDTEAQEGVYHLWAFTLGSGAAQSEMSNKIDISAVPSGAAASAIFVSSLLSKNMPFFSLVVFGILGIGYLYHRHKIEKLKLKLEKEKASVA